MLSDVGNISDIFPLYSNLFSLGRESTFAVTRIISLSAFLDLKKITFYERDELMTEPISKLSAPISAVCCERCGGGGSGGELEIMFRL
jgi:hypothetical protein